MFFLTLVYKKPVNTLCFVLWILIWLWFSGVTESSKVLTSFVYLNIDTRGDSDRVTGSVCRAIWAPQIRLPFSENEGKGWLSIGTENGANMTPETLEYVCVRSNVVWHTTGFNLLKVLTSRSLWEVRLGFVSFVFNYGDATGCSSRKQVKISKLDAFDFVLWVFFKMWFKYLRTWGL